MIAKAALITLAWTVCCYAFGLAPYETCTEPGFSCSADCTNMQYCAASTGDSQDIPCGTKFCSILDGVPSCNAESCTKVFCGVGGAIPSPTNCSQFYMCEAPSGETKDLQSCPPNTQFNTATRNCTANVTCSASSQCQNLGESGDMTNFCYVCLGPNQYFIYPCPSDTPTTTSTSSSPSTPPTTTTPPTTPNCTEVNQKFPNPTDCHSYYVCVYVNNTLSAESRTCRSDSYYDPQRLSCIKGTCTNTMDDESLYVL